MAKVVTSKPGRSRRRASDSVTLADVAHLAGVSAATASRAINQPALVSPEMRLRVQAAIEKVGYVPNLLAGGLASSRSRLVAAIVPSMGTLMFSRVVESLAGRLRHEGYQLLLGISDYDRAREEELVLAVLSRKPDAILVTGVNHTPASRRRLVNARIPVVEAWDLTRTPIDTVVGFSHEDVGRAVARYLLGKGYRRFAGVTATEERAGRRMDSFLAELRIAGIADVPVGSLVPPTSLESGRACFAGLLDQGHRPEVVFCSSDPPAHGVMIEAQSRGLRVPEDVAVMGFGDLDFAAYVTPALSTVRIEPDNVGLIAAEAILAELEGQAGREHIFDVGFRIQERESA